MCLLATRAPKSSLAESALTELDHICEMFEGSQTHCLAAANHLVCLLFTPTSTPDLPTIIRASSKAFENKHMQLRKRTTTCPAPNLTVLEEKRT